MEALEEKLSGQITRVQQQSDRLRDAAFSRFDAKLCNIDAFQPKFDRRLAELSGNFKGLSDEMQTQIRRIDLMDTRLWEWRHQLEEEIRGKFVEVEQSQQQLASSMRTATATSDDALKRYSRRIVRLEGLFEERLANTEETRQSIMNLHGRLLEVEEGRSQDLGLQDFAPGILEQAGAQLRQQEDPNDRSSIVALEVRFGDACQAMRNWQQESHDISARLEAQEERLKTLRTLVDTKDDHFRVLLDRVERADWEGRVKELKNQVQDIERQRLEHGEQLDLLRRRFSGHEVVQEEMLGHIRELRAYSNEGRAEPASPSDAQMLGAGTVEPVLPNALLLAEVGECTGRLARAEARLDSMGAELDAVRGDVELAPRVGALVQQLKQVAPKVVDHEAGLQELHERLGRLEASARAERAAGGSRSPDGVAGRLARVEVEVTRLVSELGGRG